MPTAILIKAGSVVTEAELSDTPTAKAVAGALPLKSEVRTWGDEIYFPIPVKAELDDTAAEVVDAGDLGFWPAGEAFCIFFGPTPASRGSEIRPASAVNVIGKVLADPEEFKAVEPGEVVRVEARA
jgi:hypothetical protein